jgi:hypothetical protein
LRAGSLSFKPSWLDVEWGGLLLVPARFGFDDDGPVVGKDAQRLVVSEPDKVAECAKRDFGWE